MKTQSTVAMASASVSAPLLHFGARAIVDQEINYTIVGGRFSPTANVDLTSQAVMLRVAGANDFHLPVSASSFSRTGLGGYMASIKRGFSKADILLQPFSSGDWAFSAGIEGFVPESTSITVSLIIGSQAGSATVQVNGF